MKTKNTCNLWRDTATLPRTADWSFDRSKVKRSRFNKVAQPKPTRRDVKPRGNEIIASNITVESLGVDFNKQYTIRTATIVG